MSKTDKLYKTLDTLEDEYCKIIKDELKMMSEKGIGNFYLISKGIGKLMYNRKDKNRKKIDYVTSLEGKILRLRDKLGLRDEFSLIDLVQEFSTQFDKVVFDRKGNAKALAKKFLEHNILKNNENDI